MVGYMEAFTTYPNTPESDLQPLVMHTVVDDYGDEHEFMAMCPIHAIELFRAGEHKNEE
jgi:hypothetical protein